MRRPPRTPAKPPLRLTAKDLATERKYVAAEPKPLGTLHERMQHVMHVAEGVLTDPLVDGDDLWQALQTLELEVSLHRPAKPPMAMRLVAKEDDRWR